VLNGVSYNGQYTFGTSFIVYMLGVYALAGWLILIICGGCGLTAFPMDWMSNCICKIYKPTTIDKSEVYRDIRVLVQQTTGILYKKINDAKESKQALTATQILEINQKITKIERIWEDANLNFTGGGGSFVGRIIGFVMGLASYVTLLAIVFNII